MFLPKLIEKFRSKMERTNVSEILKNKKPFSCKNILDL
jgi:hypothetical protein